MADPSRTHREAMRAALPLAVAVGGFGVSFGVLARSVGMGQVAPIVMSITTFGGSAQFAAASVLGAGGSAASAVAAALMLNLRYLPIGVSVAPSLTGGSWSRLLHAHLTVDESWALAAEGDGRYSPHVLMVTGSVLAVAWIGGTAIGVLFGGVVGDPARLGLDAAFPALFLALLAPQLRHPEGSTRWTRPLAAAILGAAIALVLTPLLPVGLPIVAAGLACLLGLRPAPEERP
jgi:4-azaleucine resistance transporter AzlC